jgi:hemolysin activation/secretion protein
MPLPEPGAPPPAPGLRVVPPAPAPALDEGPRVRVREIRIEGSTVLEPGELRALASPYEGRELGTEELHELRYRLTQLYVERGYVNSGFTLPDQSLEGGVVLYRALEGRLAEVRVEAAEGARLAPDYIAERVQRANAGVLNLGALRDSLAMLQQGGLVEQINAELVPGERPGEAVLRLQAREARATQLTVSFGNDRPPAVGAGHAELGFVHRNLTGRADALEARYGWTRGAAEYLFGYARPLAADDTTLHLRHLRSASLVVEPPFNAIEITARSKTTSAALSRPLLRFPDRELSASLAREYKSSQTFLLGFPFAFTPGVPDGHSRVRLWRIAAEYAQRAGESATALRLAWQSGTSNVESPPLTPSTPDRDFGYWTLQAQHARRLLAGAGELLARFEWQGTRDVLLPSERFALGGLAKLRGLRENQLLRDRGQFASLEYRHRMTAPESAAGTLRLAVFAEHGRSENLDGSNPEPRAVRSHGVGLLYQRAAFAGQLYLARASFRPATAHRDLQDRGVHFLAQMRF